MSNYGSSSAQPLHDVFGVRNIPSNTDGLHIDNWRVLLATPNQNPLVLKSFARAIEIEEELGGRAPKDFNEIKETLAKMQYLRHEENPSLAKLYDYYSVPTSTFNRSLDFIRDGVILPKKTQDNIPFVVVDLSKLDDKAQGYYIVKLPAGDKRGLILGDITDCCQSIGGHSERCVIDGMNREDNGFYVFIKVSSRDETFDPTNIDWSLEAFEKKGHKIIGQSYVWRTSQGNLTCDSVEMLNSHRDNLPIKEALIAMSKKMATADPSIERLTVGNGGGTQSIPGLSAIGVTTTPEDMNQGSVYGDAESQIEVWGLAEDERRSQRTMFLEKLEKTHKITGELKAKLTNTIDDPEFKLLSSQIAIDLYNNKITTFEHLKDFGADKIKALTSSYAREAYKAGATFNQLKDFLDRDIRKFKALTSSYACSAYEVVKVKFDDLSTLYDKYPREYCTLYNEYPSEYYGALKALTSYDAQECYSKEYVKFDQLKDFEDNKIKALTSVYAREAYKAGATFNQLKDFLDRDIQKFEALTSSYACSVYKDLKVKFDDLSTLYDQCHPNYDKIEALTSVYAGECYRKGYIKFDQLKDFEVDKIEALTSYAARGCYRKEYIKFDQLKDFGADKIKALTSSYAREAYKAGATFNQLKDFLDRDIRKFKALTSYDAQECYSKEYVKFDQLKDFEDNKIKALTSYEAQSAYRDGIKFDSLSKLYDQSPEKYEAHIQEEVSSRILESIGGIFNECSADVLDEVRVIGNSIVMHTTTQAQRPQTPNRPPSNNKEWER